MRFRILGPLEVFDGTRWVGVGAPKCRSVLAALLVRAHHVVPVDRLILELWGESPPRSAATQVHGYIMRLRRLLDDRDGRLIVTQAPGYRLVTGEEDVDAQIFETRAERGQRVLRAGEPERAAELLGEALDMWRGRALCDVAMSEPVKAEADRLTEERLTALEARAEADLACGRHGAVINELRRHVDEHPLRERGWEQLMVALHRAGRRAEALRAFQNLRRTLVEELGTEPGAAVQRIHRQILTGDPALAWPDGKRGEPIPAPVCQLPAGVPDFTGRDEPLDTLVRTLSDRVESAPPPVAVVFGAPGVGKSTLALHAARAAATAFPDGQIYLDLAGTSPEPCDPEPLLAEVLHALGVTGAAVPAGPHARAALLRSLLAQRRMLFVLDDAAGTEQVRWLLPPNGRCALVVTCRGLLTDLPGARHLELRELPPLEAYELFTRIVGAERVAREPEQAAAIVRSCGYLPLAIRIAAGKLLGRPMWTLRVLRTRLEDESGRLSELRLGDLGVRASFDLSLRLLPDQAVRAFRLLGLLGALTVPGWVVGPLLDRPFADDVLDLLVDANLVRLTAADGTGRPRYRLHDLLRAYAIEGAGTIPGAARRDAVARLLAAWLDLVERANDGLPPSWFRPQVGTAPRRPLPEETARRLLVEPLRWFDAEREALLGAIKLAADWDLAGPAWELAALAVPYHDHRARYEDWQRGHHLALPAARAAADRLGEAVLLRGLGQVQIYRDEYDAATASMTRSVRLFRSIGDQRGEALATAGLGTVNRMLGRHDRALRHVRRALELTIATGDRHAEAQLRASTGTILLALGEIGDAGRWFDEALDLCRELGDVHREGVVLRLASQLHHERGEPARALRCLHRALDIFTDLDDERCVAYTLLKAGHIHADRGDRAGATATLTRAAGIFRHNGTRREEARCWQLLGELEAADHNVTEARRYLTRTRRLWQSIGATDQAAEIDTALRRLDPR